MGCKHIHTLEKELERLCTMREVEIGEWKKREIPTTKWIYLPPIGGSFMGRPKQQKGNTVTKKKGS